jgi:hypothetical protein
LFAQDERRVEVSAVATPGAGDVVPFESEVEVAIEGQMTVELLFAGGVAKLI